jgi:formyltetrahydrofolate synthetase
VVKVCRQRQEQAESRSIPTTCRSRKDPHHRREIYRAKDISADKSVRDQLANFEAMGYGKFPICVAKTQYSFSTNPDAKGAPTDHVIRCARCGSRPAPNSWSRSAARS